MDRYETNPDVDFLERIIDDELDRAARIARLAPDMLGLLKRTPLKLPADSVLRRDIVAMIRKAEGTDER